MSDTPISDALEALSAAAHPDEDYSDEVTVRTDPKIAG